MKFFNAFQLTLLFVAYPFLIQWVQDKTFMGAGALFWILTIAYVVHFFGTIVAYAELIDRTN